MTIRSLLSCQARLARIASHARAAPLKLKPLQSSSCSSSSTSTSSMRFIRPRTVQVQNHQLKLARFKRHQSTTTNTTTAASDESGGFLRELMLKPRTISVPRWISPKYYTTTLAEIAGHSSFILVAISYAVDDFFHLRIIAVAGSSVMLCFTYFHPHGRVLWLPFKWNALFIAINSYRIGKVILDRYLAEKISPDMLQVRDAHFHVFDPPDFARLVRIGRVEVLNKGDTLVRQGELNQYIRLVLDGEFHVYRDGKLTYKIEEGNFISEVGLHAGLLLPGKVESCCSIVATKPGRCLMWERNELMDLLRREKQLRRALKVALSWDIMRKLKGQRKLESSGIIQNSDEWTHRRTQQNQHRYAAILQNMLAHPKYMKERKEELLKYRLIHHIDDTQHERALKLYGWTMEDFERGYKDGIKIEEEDDDIKHDLKWFAHDVYMRIFG